MCQWFHPKAFGPGTAHSTCYTKSVSPGSGIARPQNLRKKPGFYIGGWHDDYDNSRILIPEVFSPLHLDGDPVVCLPNRNSLLKDGEVADFSVAENSLIFNDVERAKKVSELFYYQQQTGSLVKLYQEKGKDLFVANYTLNRLETGGYESMRLVKDDSDVASQNRLHRIL
jgi:hypothetical protein